MFPGEEMNDNEVRMWCIEAADKFMSQGTGEQLISLAAKIEKYVRDGQKEDEA